MTGELLEHGQPCGTCDGTGREAYYWLGERRTAECRDCGSRTYQVLRRVPDLEGLELAELRTDGERTWWAVASARR